MVKVASKREFSTLSRPYLCSDIGGAPCLAADSQFVHFHHNQLVCKTGSGTLWLTFPEGNSSQPIWLSREMQFPVEAILLQVFSVFY